MAQVTNLPTGFRTVWIWDITSPVGPGQVNKRTDIMLIQSLINEVAERLGLRDLRKGTAGPTGLQFPKLAQLAEDGYWGPETAAAVDSYQENARIRAGVKRDGRVDPVHPLISATKGQPASPAMLNAISSISRRMILHLNLDHLIQKGRMMDEREFPSVLQAELQHS